VEQTGLLAELAAINDEMRELLGDLQTSTFVRRLKAASREQLGIAGDLNKTLAAEFGVGVTQLSQDAVAIAKTGGPTPNPAKRTDAPDPRRPEGVLSAPPALAVQAPSRSDAGCGGRFEDSRDRGIVGCESQWPFDYRVGILGGTPWTVGRRNSSRQRNPEAKARRGNRVNRRVCPKLVLEVMKILRDEIDLRDETREAEKAKPALDGEEFAGRAKGLEETQKGLRDRSYAVVKKIEGIPGGAETFQREVELLSGVAKILGEARNILAKPDTGPEAIAAETEAIELLLQARRNPPRRWWRSSSSSQSAGPAQQGIDGVGPGADQESLPRGPERRPIPRARADGNSPKSFAAGWINISTRWRRNRNEADIFVGLCLGGERLPSRQGRDPGSGAGREFRRMQPVKGPGRLPIPRNESASTCRISRRRTQGMVG